MGEFVNTTFSAKEILLGLLLAIVAERLTKWFRPFISSALDLVATMSKHWRRKRIRSIQRKLDTFELISANARARESYVLNKLISLQLYGVASILLLIMAIAVAILGAYRSV
jgi:hypothetical protein